MLDSRILVRALKGCLVHRVCDEILRATSAWNKSGRKMWLTASYVELVGSEIAVGVNN